MKAINALCVVGTRPEAIKMAPVVLAMKSDSRFAPILLASSQHTDMLAQSLDVFGLAADVDLALMTTGQPMDAFIGRAFLSLSAYMESASPDCVVAQGDTATVMVAAMVAFFRRIPFFHVEAGLRSGNLALPFPEEYIRIVVSRAASIHFAPTQRAVQNLLAESVIAKKIVQTGNTVVDALKLISDRQPDLPQGIDASKRVVLVTVHRRESFGDPLIEICRAILAVANRFSDVQFVVPVHPNPNVDPVIRAHLGSHSGICLLPPLAYHALVAVLKVAYLVLTDSGGIQEEAPTFGVPVLILRDVTERPEGVELGVSKLTGTGFDSIVSDLSCLLSERSARARMSRDISPYGDGNASARIVSTIAAFFSPGGAQ